MQIDVCIFSDTHLTGIPVESFSACNFKKKLHASNADVKGQYFTINVNSRNVVAIANTLIKYTKWFGETCLVKVFTRSKEKNEADSCSMKCSVDYRFGAPTGFLETLKTTRFTVGF